MADLRLQFIPDLRPEFRGPCGIFGPADFISDLSGQVFPPGLAEQREPGAFGNLEGKAVLLPGGGKDQAVDLELAGKALEQRFHAGGQSGEALELAGLNLRQHLPYLFIDPQGGGKVKFLFHLHKPQAIDGGIGPVQVFDDLILC